MVHNQLWRLCNISVTFLSGFHICLESFIFPGLRTRSDSSTKSKSGTDYLPSS